MLNSKLDQKTFFFISFNMSSILAPDFANMSSTEQANALANLLVQTQRRVEEEKQELADREEREKREAEERAARKAARKAAKKGKKRAIETEEVSGTEGGADEGPKPKKRAKVIEEPAETKDESPLEVAEVACKK
jgi:hypothetical protein